jgi:hypothetical protein
LAAETPLSRTPAAAGTHPHDIKESPSPCYRERITKGFNGFQWDFTGMLCISTNFITVRLKQNVENPPPFFLCPLLMACG